MSAQNSCTFYGNLTRDPELRFIASGDAVCDFGIAVNGFKEGDTTFLNCTAWRKQAEIISENFVKGKPILIQGELKQDNWEDKDGNKKTSFKVDVNNFTFVGKREDSPSKKEVPVGAGADVPF